MQTGTTLIPESDAKALDYKRHLGSIGGHSMFNNWYTIGKQIVVEAFDKSKNKIGGGGQGVVYEIELTVEGEKLVLACKKQDDVMGVTEMETMLYCKHSNLMNLRYYCKDTTHTYMIMDKMDCDLDVHIPKITSQIERVIILLEIARGIAYLHSKKLMHRDIKPKNVLLKLDNESNLVTQVKIADFGFAKISNAKAVHTKIGTQGFEAPEVQQGKTCEASDVYSFGVLLKQVYVNVKPYVSAFATTDFPCETHPTILLLHKECTRDNVDARPKMQLVTSMLEDVLAELYCSKNNT